MLNLNRIHNLLIKRAICTTAKLKQGYIVLVPEIGEDNDSKNVLINEKGLPKFNHLTVENCLASIAKQSGIVETTVKSIEIQISKAENEIKLLKKENDDETTYDDDKNLPINSKLKLVENVLNPLENVTSELEIIWGIAKTLYLGNSSLMPTKCYLNIHERAKRAKSSKYNNPIIYNYILENLKLLSESKSESLIKLNLDEKRLATKYLLEGKLNGLELSDKDKIKLNKILSDLFKERTIYKNKVDMSTRQFSHNITNYSLIRNFPPELQYTIATDKNHPTKGPWKITLQSSQLINDFLKYCPDRDERWNIWQANVRKATNYFDKSLDNSTHIETIRSLRQRQAQLLGYKTYTEMSMQTKMIKTYDNAKQLFSTLLKYSKDAQLMEFDTLQEFAAKNGFKYKLNLYDIPYWKRKFLKSEYNLDEEQLREYFPLPHVLNEILKLCENLFDIKFFENKNIKTNPLKTTSTVSSSSPSASESSSSISTSQYIEVWNESVRYYDIYDKNDDSNSIGGIYLDFQSRDNNEFKTNSGWMVGVRNRSNLNNEIKKPLSALIFNFGTSIYGKPYLCTINDLKIILRNFGNALQHLLTKSKYCDISGLSNIEWDAAGVSGNIMINLLENHDILQSLSCHYNDGEKLQKPTILTATSTSNIHNNDSIIKLYNNHMAGYNLCKELYLSDLDLLLYSTDKFWIDCIKKLWPIYIPSHELDKKDFHLCSMTDIMSGDWSAAYFSHLHSKMIADDIFDSFYDNKTHDTSSSSPSSTTIDLLSNKAIIKRYRDMFLLNDGSLSTAETFRRYRGRDPSPLPFLKRSNLFNKSINSNDDDDNDSQN